MDNIGIGFVGTGRIAWEHARSIEALSERARLVAIADNSEQAVRGFTEAFFVPTVAKDYKELAAREDVQVISVLTPPSTHVEIIEHCLSKGKYVVCEKPLAPNLEEFDKIAELDAKYPNRLSVVFQLRYMPEVLKMKALLADQAVGAPVTGWFSRRDHHPSTKGNTASWWGSWKVAGGGALMTQFVHELDLMIEFFGEPSDVMAMMATYKGGIESEDTFSASVRFKSGAIVNGTCTLCSGAFDFSFGIATNAASMNYPWRFDSQDAALQKLGSLESSAEKREKAVGLVGKIFRKVKNKAMSKLGFVTRRENSKGSSRHAPYYASVLDSIASNSPMESSVTRARASLELCAALYKSALTGERVCVPIDRNDPIYGGVDRHVEQYGEGFWGRRA